MSRLSRASSRRDDDSEPPRPDTVDVGEEASAMNERHSSSPAAISPLNKQASFTQQQQQPGAQEADGKEKNNMNGTTSVIGQTQLAESERESLFNMDRRSVWFLPRKPTKLFMIDVISRAQLLTNEKPWYILIPSGHWRVVWGYVILMISTVDVIVCVGCVSFCQVPYTGWYLFVSQLFFLVDMLLNFVSSYITPRGTLELDPSVIARDYVVNGPFLFDLAGLLPLEFLLTPCWHDSEAGCYDRLVSGSIAFTINWQWTRVLRWFVKWRKHDSFRSITTTENDGILDCLKYLFLIVLVLHCSTCILYSTAQFSMPAYSPVCDASLQPLPVENVSIAVLKHNAYDKHHMVHLPISACQYVVETLPELAQTSGSGVADLSTVDVTEPFFPCAQVLLEGERTVFAHGKGTVWDSPIVNLYVYYFYVSIGNLLGDGQSANTAPTRLTSVLFMLVGNILFALVFGEVIMAMSNGARTRDLFAQRMRSINEALEHSGVEGKFRRRVRRFYEYVWLSVRSKRVAREFIEELPDALRVDIVTSSYAEMLRKVPFFFDVTTDCISAIAQRLESYVFMPDELIIKEGLVGKSMFFVELGLVSVIKARGTPEQFEVCRLRDGAFFGEIAVTAPLGSIRTSSVASVTVVNLQRLTRQALEEVANLFPDVLTYIRQIALERRHEIGEDNRIAKSLAVSALPRMARWRKSVCAKRHSVSSAAGRSRVTPEGGGGGGGGGGSFRGSGSSVQPSPVVLPPKLSPMSPAARAAAAEMASPAQRTPAPLEEADPTKVLSAMSEDFLHPSSCGRVGGFSTGDDDVAHVIQRMKASLNTKRSTQNAVAVAAAVGAAAGAGGEEPEWLGHLRNMVGAIGEAQGVDIQLVSTASK